MPPLGPAASAACPRALGAACQVHPEQDAEAALAQPLEDSTGRHLAEALGAAGSATPTYL